jgi:hypothetical protein
MMLPGAVVHIRKLVPCTLPARLHLDAVAGSETRESVLSAALLDMQALQLKQALFSADSSAAGSALPGRAPGATLEAADTAAPSAATDAAAPPGGLQRVASLPGLKQEPPTAATSSGSGSSGGGSGAGDAAMLLPWSGLDTPEEGAVMSSASSSSNRTKRLLASITPADVLRLQGLPLEGLAGVC